MSEIEALELFCQALENAVQVLRIELKKIEKPKPESQARIPEKETFGGLTWRDEKGEKLGAYQVSYRNHNAADSWQHAYNILKANKSLIDSRFHEPGYEYSYWVFSPKFEDRIYRQQLKKD